MASSSGPVTHDRQPEIVEQLPQPRPLVGRDLVAGLSGGMPVRATTTSIIFCGSSSLSRLR